MAKNKIPATGKSRKTGSAALQAMKPKIKVTDSKIKPPPATPYAKVAVKDGDGKNWDLPVLKGTLGPDVIDVRKLYTEHGLFTYDPGYGSTGSTQSAITYIDGEV